MGSPNIRKEIIDGFLTVTRTRRTCYEVQVYDGESDTDELIGDWEMPKALYRSDATRIAVDQSRSKSKRLKDEQRSPGNVAEEKTFSSAMQEVATSMAQQMAAAKETEGDTA